MEAMTTWQLEKLDLITSLISRVDKDVVRDQLTLCTTDGDVNLIIQTLLQEEEDLALCKRIEKSDGLNLNNSNVESSRLVVSENEKRSCGNLVNPSALTFSESDSDSDSSSNYPQGADQMQSDTFHRADQMDIGNPQGAYQVAYDTPKGAYQITFNTCQSADNMTCDTPQIADHMTYNIPQRDDHMTRDEVQMVSVKNKTHGVSKFFREESKDDEEKKIDKQKITEREEDRLVEERVMTQVIQLSEMFKDADPDYLQERCWEIKGSPDRFLSVVQKLMFTDYPKIGDYMKRKKEKEFQDYLQNLSVEQYMLLIKDSEEEELKERKKEECSICYDEVECLSMISCDALRDRHQFCGECVRRFAEAEIGQGRSSFRCPEIECKGTISDTAIRELLPVAVMKRVLLLRQQEEIARASITDLESCPFCDYKVIMPNKHDKVFLCQNPGCMKDSCRSCKELNHIPKTCQEVKAESQKDVRTMMENRMAEAMIRECSTCGKRFIKGTGCNKMQCPCGMKMCYLCKQPVNGYDHFTTRPEVEPNKCPLWREAEDIHGSEVRQAAAQAKREIDPDLDLVYDPTEDQL